MISKPSMFYLTQKPEKVCIHPLKNSNLTDGKTVTITINPTLFRKECRDLAKMAGKMAGQETLK